MSESVRKRTGHAGRRSTQDTRVYNSEGRKLPRPTLKELDEMRERAERGESTREQGAAYD